MEKNSYGGYLQRSREQVSYRDGPSQPADFRSVVSSSHMYVLENGSLVIRDVEKQDAGSYLCEASNGVGESLAEVVKLSVNVFYCTGCSLKLGFRESSNVTGS
ncbi:hypothetical protein TNCT_120371 [Trichonephila clavata]|uniref:Immunoglobulin I-set domain-containing protein n=1 Tax=Trichonephila clavata TaxID=2740835 RepID=A0A8X6JEG7_TRICU|nr:hypothetical protein TNCT_120371 [Trichonephila clavata]